MNSPGRRLSAPVGALPGTPQSTRAGRKLDVFKGGFKVLDRVVGCIAEHQQAADSPFRCNAFYHQNIQWQRLFFDLFTGSSEHYGGDAEPSVLSCTVSTQTEAVERPDIYTPGPIQIVELRSASSGFAL